MYIKKVLLGLASPILLTACSDFVDKIADGVNNDLDAIHDKINGSCVTNGEGDLWFSAKDNSFYQCTNGNWVQIQVDATPAENNSTDPSILPDPVFIDDSIFWIDSNDTILGIRPEIMPSLPIFISKDCNENGDKYKVTNDWTIYQCINGHWIPIHEDWQPMPFPVLSSSSFEPPVMSSSSSDYPPIAMAPVYLDDYMWRGDENLYQINTELDNGSETSGYWFIFSDDADGGSSRIIWPVDQGNYYSDDALDPIIDVCGGLCGSYELSKGTLDYDPFVGVGFNVAGEDVDGSITAADASDWGGICLSYASSHPVTVELGLTYEKEREYEWDLPIYTLPKSTTGSIKCIPWDNFKPMGWGSKTIRGEEASKQLASIRFKIQNRDKSKGTFNFMSIGKLQHSSPVVDPPVYKAFQWYGNEYVYKIETGFDAGYETSGYWYEFTDNADNGKSKILWPVNKGSEYYDDALDPIIDYCEGICGTAILDKGTMNFNPYVGIGFDIAGGDENFERVAADVTPWEGVCVEYTSEIATSLEMDLGDYMNSQLGVDVPFVSMPKSTTPVTKCYAWNKFSQAGWGTGKSSGVEAATKLVGLRIKIQGASRTTAKFNIKAIYSMSSVQTIKLYNY